MTSNEAQAKELAEGFRGQHALGLVPIKDVFELVHSAMGLDVMSVEAAETEHGLTMLDPATGRVVMVVAVTPHPMRQRSSVAHELGHVLTDDLSQPDGYVSGERTPQEVRADAFARHLLLPVEAVRSRLGQGADGASEQALSTLVQEFEVSPQIAAIQMRDAGVIDQHTCTRWSTVSTRTLAARFGWLSQYETLAAASLKPRAPQSLMTRAVEGYRHGILGIAELAQWYGRTTDELRDELPSPLAVSLDPVGDPEAPLFPEDMGQAAP